MGAHPYYYFVEYQPDVGAALQALRQREFQAGRYNPVVAFPEFPVGSRAPAQGCGHASIELARHAADADCTRSILDLHFVSDEPEFCAVSPLSDFELKKHFGTTQPTHEMVERNMAFFTDIDRGQGIYIVIYKQNKPSEIFFAGYSFD